MMQKGRALGLNVLRCHIKVCDPDYLAAADEVGMLVWYRVPSWERWTPASLERGKAIFDAMTKRDWNRPSIVIQTLINEAWGIDMKQADQRAGLLKWFEESRPKLQPLGRLLVDNSPCCENFHLKTDIDDYHQVLLDSRQRRPLGQMGGRLRDASRLGVQQPRRRGAHESGSRWSCPSSATGACRCCPPSCHGGLRATSTAAPSRGRPGLFDRFHGFGFDRVFGDYPTLARETQWRQFYSLKHEIESMRRHAPIQGYIITEFTDINWEVNGLMDMWRRPKIYAERLAAIQQPDVLLPSTAARNVLSGAKIQLDVQLSHYSGRPATGSVIKWTTTSGQTGERPVTQDVPRGGVGDIASLALTAPPVDHATLEQVTLELKAADGSVLARNTHDLFVYPSPPPVPEGVVLHDPNALLGPLPWQAAALMPAATVVSSVFDAEVRAHVEGGGTAVVLASKVLFGVVEAPGLNIVERRGELDGNWVTNFTWLHTGSALFSGLGLTRVTGFEAAAATPRALIDGVAPDVWRQGDVLSGVFYGWINQNHATTVQCKVGKGKVVFTTLDAHGLR